MDIFEKWEYIKNTNELYMVSNYGRVKSMPREIITPFGKYYTKEKILKGSKNKKGYVQVEFRINNKRNINTIHRLVLSAFVENPLNKPQINHKDGNKENNRVDNLEWVTQEENMKHAIKHNLIVNPSGRNARNFKYLYSSEENKNIKNMTALEIAKYINENIKKCNVISTANNIRGRQKAFGMIFRKEVVQ